MSRRKVFVAYPYSLFPREDYRKVFETLSKKYFADFQFADDHISNDYILNKITQMITTSDISLFDITGWNPNVTLELGIAMALDKKPYILFNTRATPNNDAPSDIRGKERIQYASYSELELNVANLLIQLNFTAAGELKYTGTINKETIVDLLNERPGLRIAVIAEAMNTGTATVQPIVRSMLLEGLLKTRGEGRGTIYFNIDTDLRRVPRR